MKSTVWERKGNVIGHRAFVTRKKHDIPEAERQGREMCSNIGDGGQKLKGCETHFACKDVLCLPQFLFVVGPHDSHISFCLFLGVFSLYNMLNLKHLENQQRQKYHYCHGSNWVERNVKDRLQNQQDMFPGFLSERCFDQALVWTWKIGV